MRRRRLPSYGRLAAKPDGQRHACEWSSAGTQGSEKMWLGEGRFVQVDSSATLGSRETVARPGMGMVVAAAGREVVRLTIEEHVGRIGRKGEGAGRQSHGRLDKHEGEVERDEARETRRSRGGERCARDGPSGEDEPCE